ncbi:recombinase family protein [Dysosmobacter sp. Phy]
MFQHVIEIPQTQKDHPIWDQQLRVAAYCRTSTNQEEQNSSLENQIAYYTAFIQSNPMWRFVAAYADQASRLHTKNRPGYRKLLRDCRRGKIDLILVKSLSRFGRDAREAIATIRKLKQMNVGIYIELGGIFTMKTPDSVIDLYAAFAQAESQTRSESIKFGIQNRMRSGRTILNHRQFLGYTKGPDGVLQIVPEEAEIVRKIFELYIQGNGVRKIKKYLESHGIKTVTGKTEWSTSTIDRMLSNEKYVGQVLMQKTYTPDFLTGKQVKNTGQKEMYLVENAHEPIIDQETFDKVQKMKGQIKRTADMQIEL